MDKYASRSSPPDGPFASWHSPRYASRYDVVDSWNFRNTHEQYRAVGDGADGTPRNARSSSMRLSSRSSHFDEQYR